MRLFVGLMLFSFSHILWSGDIDIKFSQAGEIRYQNYSSGGGYKSHYLDNCYRYANDCGTKTAADAWCREYMGFAGGAVSQQAGARLPAGEKTKIIGDGRSCTGNCGIYKSVTCTTTNPTIFNAPKYRGFRLDSSEISTGGKTDADVAELYCQSFGFEKAFRSYSVGDVGEPTKRIGDDSLCVSGCGGFTSITCGTFKVKSPISGKQLETGKPVSIQWTRANGSPVKIELYKAGGLRKTITSRTGDDGEYEWVVDSELLEGVDYTIKVSEYNGKYSDSVGIRITDPAPVDFINILTPSSSNKYYRGENVSLEWTNSASITSHRIELLNESGTLKQLIKSRTNNKSYSWSIPLSLATGRYKIRIKDYHNPETYDDTPVFAVSKLMRSLSVELNNQNGTVVDSKGRINCPGTCTTDAYENGEEVTLTATPKTGYAFQSFSGCSASGDSCNFTLDSNKTISANFSTSSSYRLTANVSAEQGATGTVDSNPHGISQCNWSQGTCSANFSEGTVTLIASPDANSEVHYSGCSQVTGNECEINLTSNKSVQVSFQPKPSIEGDLKLEFDPFPARNIYKINELTEEANGLQIRLRVKSDNPNAQINRVDLDWTGTGKTTACRPDDGSATIEVDELLVCSSKDLGSNPFVNGAIYTMTSTAYGASNTRSNMLKFRYKTVSTSDSDKYTGTQNPDHMEKFWVIDPNTEKKGFFVDTARGTQVLQLNFLHQLGIVGLDFSLQYNSGFAEKEIGKLGKGWNHNYGMMARLDLSKESKEITVKWSNNRKLTLTKVGNEYIDNVTNDERIEEGRLSGQYDKLIKDGDGTYLLTKKDKSKYRFDSSGKLTFVKNKYQQVLALEYNGEQLDKIREIDSQNSDTGIYLEYEYDAQGQIKIVKDAERQVVLHYQDGCLTAVQDPENIEHKFDYVSGSCLMKKYSRYQPGVGSVVLFQNNIYDSTTGALTSQQDGKSQTTTFAYDETKPGLITTTSNSPAGYQTSNTYNTNYQLLDHQVIDNGTVYQTQYSYTQAGMLRRKREAPETSQERKTSYEYDKNGNTTKIIYPDGKFIERIYDDQNNLKQETNEQKLVTLYNYNLANNTLESKSLPYGEGNRAQVTYKYNNDAQLISVTKPGSNATQTTYENGRVKTVSDPEGNTTSYRYDAAGNIKNTTIKNASGDVAKIMDYDYDKLGRETRRTSYYQSTPLSVVSSYSVCGDVARVQDAKGNVTEYHYDKNCNLETVDEPEGKTTHYEYDAEDRKIATIDANNQKQGVTYNALGLVTEEWIGSGASRKTLFTHSYDVLGNLTASYQQADDAGNGQFRTLLQEYDIRDRITLQADTHHKTQYEYGSYGRLTKINEYDDCSSSTSCSGSYRTTTYGYFDDNQLASVTDAENGKANQQFDARNNRTQLKDPKNNTTGFNYDGNDNENKQTPAAGSPATRQYNALQLLDWVRNGRGQEERYTYYENGWLKTIAFNGKKWTYAYDSNGNVLQISGSDGAIKRTYDSLNRVKSYQDMFGQKIQYGYYPNSQLKTMQFDGHQVDYTYDEQGRLATVAWDGEQLVGYSYTRQGRLKSEARNNNTKREYTYTKDRLTGITDKNTQTNEVIVAFTMEYNSVGDITRETVSPEPTLEQLKIPAAKMTYQADNRLETFNGKTVKFDDDGNMVEGPLGEDFATFTYDTRNRLVSVGNTEYEYTVENNRVKVTNDGKSTEYLVNPHAALSQVLIKKDSDGSKTYYIYGNGLIAQISQNNTHFYHYDLRGSTVALTNAGGSITDQFLYMSYGHTIRLFGSLDTVFSYIGKEGVLNDYNSLFYMRNRYYEVSSKRFISKDYILGGIRNTQSLNRYIYTQSNPVNKIDPEGTLPITPLVILASAALSTGLFSEVVGVSQMALKGDDAFLPSKTSDIKGIAGIASSSIDIYESSREFKKASQAAHNQMQQYYIDEANEEKSKLIMPPEVEFKYTLDINPSTQERKPKPSLSYISAYKSYNKLIGADAKNSSQYIKERYNGRDPHCLRALNVKKGAIFICGTSGCTLSNSDIEGFLGAEKAIDLVCN